DETGDRLTPSHARSRTGARLRYYLSHRLIARSGDAHPGAWRLPAGPIEDRVAGLIRRRLSEPGFAAALLPGAVAETIAGVDRTLAEIGADDQASLLSLVARITIAPGTLELAFDGTAVADRVSVERAEIHLPSLTSAHAFHLRKRGVETRIMLDGAPCHRDETLIRNIARAHVWFERIKAGETVSQIAETEGTSRRRVQQLLPLAFLAPDIVRDALEARQPAGLTSDWLIRHELPADWTEQRALLATL
ncbi:MAG: recombinase family protein, partial [Pseudomonadota bacterium]